MNDNKTKRLSRLTAILTRLQSKQLVSATKLAEKFGVTVRTIYRDIKALEEAGVPVITEDGLGYRIMDGYRIPPVMFTESEANALITVELLAHFRDPWGNLWWINERVKEVNWEEEMKILEACLKKSNDPSVNKEPNYIKDSLFEAMRNINKAR